jgi:hypothetical protein
LEQKLAPVSIGTIQRSSNKLKNASLIESSWFVPQPWKHIASVLSVVDKQQNGLIQRVIKKQGGAQKAAANPFKIAHWKVKQEVVKQHIIFLFPQ